MRKKGRVITGEARAVGQKGSFWASACVEYKGKHNRIGCSSVLYDKRRGIAAVRVEKAADRSVKSCWQC